MLLPKVSSPPHLNKPSMEGLLAAFERASISSTSNKPQMSYDDLGVLRDKYHQTLRSYMRGDFVITIERDAWILIVKNPAVKLYPPTHLIIVQDPHTTKDTYLPCHSDLWNAASSYHLCRRDSDMPWECLQPHVVEGNVSLPLSLVHMLLYLCIPLEIPSDCLDSMLQAAEMLEMPHLVNDIQLMISGNAQLESEVG
ncbi:hypothetical protein DL96DRAFT_1613769 [Flagelloscypha sp. PMI_526]|nr:hypothetical protein DL96DRAFT_1613769 [Flagelloscypha sp. PMI_526]